MSDEELIIDYRDTGNPGSFAELVSRYKDELTNCLRVKIGDYAEDVAQEAFLRVHTQCQKFKTGQRFRPWLFTFALNKAIDVVRYHELRPTAPIVDVAVNSTQMFESDELEWVRKEVSRLPSHQREILERSHFRGQKYREIAHQLGVPLGTVKSRAGKGLEKLRHRYHRLVPA